MIQLLTTQGDWQTGTSTDVAAVVVSLEQDDIVINFGHGRVIRQPLAKTIMSSRMANLPLRLNFTDGTQLTIPDGEFAKLLSRGRSGRLAAIEGNFWRLLIPLVLGTGVAIYIFVEFLMPVLAGSIAARLPVSMANSLGDEFYQKLNQDLAIDDNDAIAKLGDLALTEARPGFILERDEDDYNFKFLSYTENGSGPNAFALPNGHIVFSQSLQKLLTDEELYAVAAHEISHVLRRHSLEAIVRVISWYALGAFLLNDYAFLTAPLILAELAYSRNKEAEADCDAVLQMRRVGRDPTAMISALTKITNSDAAAPKAAKEVLSESDQRQKDELEELERQRQAARGDEDGTIVAKEQAEEDAAESTATSLLRSIFSTHPLDADRTALIKRCLATAI